MSRDEQRSWEKGKEGWKKGEERELRVGTEKEEGGGNRTLKPKAWEKV